MSEPEKAEFLKQALESPDIRKLYANGFANALGTGDITIVLNRNNVPVGVLNLSYTAAKTLAVKLMELIQKLEEETGNEIMTIDFLQKVLLEKMRKVE